MSPTLCKVYILIFAYNINALLMDFHFMINSARNLEAENCE